MNENGHSVSASSVLCGPLEFYEGIAVTQCDISVLDLVKVTLFLSNRDRGRASPQKHYLNYFRF